MDDILVYQNIFQVESFRNGQNNSSVGSYATKYKQCKAEVNSENLGDVDEWIYQRDKSVIIGSMKVGPI